MLEHTHDGPWEQQSVPCPRFIFKKQAHFHNNEDEQPLILAVTQSKTKGRYNKIFQWLNYVAWFTDIYDRISIMNVLFRIVKKIKQESCRSMELGFGTEGIDSDISPSLSCPRNGHKKRKWKYQTIIVDGWMEKNNENKLNQSIL